jgi:peptidoglycan hydrolase CwlO-like protein
MENKYKPSDFFVEVQGKTLSVDTFLNKTEIRIPFDELRNIRIGYESYGYDLECEHADWKEVQTFLENKNQIVDSVYSGKEEIEKLNKKIHELKNKLNECKRERDLLIKTIKVIEK